jgi:hypothetical protein
MRESCKKCGGTGRMEHPNISGHDYSAPCECKKASPFHGGINVKDASSDMVNVMKALKNELGGES